MAVIVAAHLGMFVAVHEQEKQDCINYIGVSDISECRLLRTSFQP